MPWCEDKAINYLNRYGYNVIKLPRAGIEPLTVLGRDRGVQPLGTAADFWGMDGLPQASDPQPTAFASGVESDKLDLKLGLNVLQNALRGLGISVLDGGKLQAGYNSAATLTFKILNPVSVCVQPMALGSYLQDKQVDWSNPLISRYLEDDDRDLYVITDVLKSSELGVMATSKQGAAIDVDVDLLKGALSGNVNIHPLEGESSNTLQYTGGSLITFGFKCFKVRYSGGTWKLRDVEASADLSFDLNAAPAEPEGDLLSSGGLLRLSA